MKIRDRIKSLRRVKASELLPNPRNWRTHPQEQQDAMRGLLAEIGFAGAALARETQDGLQLIDGHLRAELSPDAKIPVLVLDVTEAEADKLLATFDPVGAMAEADHEALAKLLAEIDTESDALQAMLDGTGAAGGIDQPETLERPGVDIGDITYRVIVSVSDETQQAQLIERLESEGFECLPLMS